MKTFPRGIDLKDEKKLTSHKTIKEALYPHKVALPLQQSLGCPNDPWVKVGDEVVEGQKIAGSDKLISAPIHASISGKVVKIEKLPNPCGFDVPSIVIEANAEKQSQVISGSRWSVEELTPEQIKKIVREAGIVGLGGAAFPTHVKLSPPPGKKIDTLIINGCECEPYITADYRVMLERTEDVIIGARAIARALGVERIMAGIEDNKKGTIEKLIAESRKLKAEIQIVQVKTKYPQGGEKQLIKALLNREVPSGGLPLDVGVVVDNVSTAAAVAEAVTKGIALTKRVITVAGQGIKEPQNLLVRIGTSFAEVISQCGGLTEDTAKVIMGGPMMGITLASLDMPVVKATTCILALTGKEAKNYEEGACIRCGRCIKACPMGLMPNFLSGYVKLKNWEEVGAYHVADCIECGCCAYVCPSRIPLVQYFKMGKLELQTRKTVCR